VFKSSTGRKVGTRINPKGFDLEIETLYFEWTRRK